ncbi:helix-turn-helix transcriptional regulator [Gemmobacter nanjingensis]|uniref:Helix-turn-helix transcriptional regulator n=2 Tax=Gemmobacter nanjingensis TaxID=488454 RepID=A0ABQ3F6M1_9RHOB|nr:helix-turn-helix transcriptional regulator [Gemmobacter nanjingensis]
MRKLANMTERPVKPPTAQFAEREQKAEIVDRLYEVALDPIRLEELLEVWEDRAASLRSGPVDHAVVLDDPEIDAHINRARVFLDRYEATREEGGYRLLLDDIPRSAAFVSDGGPKITACNRPAQHAFGLSDGAALTALPFDAEDVDTLRAVIRKVALGLGEQVATLRIRSVTTGSPVILRVSRIAAPGPHPLALVISTELYWPSEFSATVQEAFGLTLAEVEIVRGITLGLPLKDIAEQRGRSIETVRTQARSILAKTETHSQSELVRVVLGLMDVSFIPTSGVREVAGPGLLRDVEFQHLRGPAGRRLEFIEFGAPGGVPVLFMHLDYGLIRWPAEAERQAERRGLRIIVPVRAGYGESDLHGRGTDHVQGVAEDYAAVLDHLGIAQVAVIALGADLRFALALADLRPGMVSGVIGCAAQLPLRTAAQYERMDKWQRFILANARYAPKVLPFLVQAGFSLARKLGKEKFFAQVNGGSPADMETFADPQVREAMLAGSEVCLAARFSAHEAFTRECISSERDWSALIRRCKVPVLLLQGDQDPQTPVQTIRELMDDYPRLRVEFLPATGQLLFFREWRQVLDRLAEFLPR